jgi:ABC-2 type transport system ATP-binding protein
MLSLSALSLFRSSSHPALHAVSLAVQRGELVALVGPAGAGKTAVLECCAGLRPPADGDIRLDGVDLTPELAAASLAYVPAVPSLPGEQRLAEHVRDRCTRFGRRMPGEVIAAALRRGGVPDAWHAVPLGACPPAIRRQTAFTLATLRNVELLLLDDPLHGLAPGDVAPFTAGLRRLRKAGTALLVATRDLAWAREVASTLVLLENGAVTEVLPLHTSRREHHAESYLAALVG